MSGAGGLSTVEMMAQLAALVAEQRARIVALENENVGLKAALAEAHEHEHEHEHDEKEG